MPMLGAPVEMGQESIAKYTTFVQNYYNNIVLSVYLFKVIEVKEATQQLVNGLIIRFHVLMAQTECKKNDPTHAAIELCPYNPQVSRLVDYIHLPTFFDNLSMIIFILLPFFHYLSIFRGFTTVNSKFTGVSSTKQSPSPIGSAEKILQG